MKHLRATMFNNARKRVNGKFEDKRWLGLPLILRKEFNEWFSGNKWLLKKLLKNYLQNGGSRKYAPSLNRIDSSRGYIQSNMEIITQGDNSRIAGAK